MNREINTELDILKQMIETANWQMNGAIKQNDELEQKYWQGQFEALKELKERCEELSRVNWEQHGERRMQA